LKTHERGVPPLILESQCNAATEWKRIIDSLRLSLTSRDE
jgi:hypothetical protein